MPPGLKPEVHVTGHLDVVHRTTSTVLVICCEYGRPKLTEKTVAIKQYRSGDDIL